MDQGDGSPVEEFQDRFARIEAAIDAGDADLRRLGYFELLRRVKAEPALAQHWADTVGRIDRKAFEARVHPRFPVWFGNATLVVGMAVGAGAAAYAFLCDNPTIKGWALLASGVVWSVSAHDLAHYVVGRLEAIRFIAYFLDGPFRVQPGLKSDYATYLRAAPDARARMHAAGAVASKLAPFVSLGLWPASNAPAWSAWALLGVGSIQLATDVVWSMKKSDWKKARREARIAHAHRTRGR